jgi:hypothetical protein
MSSEPVAPVEIPAPPAETVGDTTQPAKKPKRAIFVHPKIQKQIDALKAKNDKLVADAKGLKKHIAELKSSHSRIRRIPKPAAPAASTE